MSNNNNPDHSWAAQLVSNTRYNQRNGRLGQATADRFETDFREGHFYQTTQDPLDQFEQGEGGSRGQPMEGR